MLTSLSVFITSSLTFFKKNALAITVYTLVGFVITYPITYAMFGLLTSTNPGLLLFLTDPNLFIEQGGTVKDITTVGMGVFGIFSLVLWIINLWIQIGLSTTINNLLISGTKSSVWSTLLSAKSRLIPTAGVTVLVIVYSAWVFFLGYAMASFATVLLASGVGIFADIIRVIGLLIVIAGCVYLLYESTRLVFSPFFVMIDGLPVRESMKRSQVLVQNRWLDIFYHLLASVVVAVIAKLVLDIMINGMMRLASLNSVLFSIASFVAPLPYIILLPIFFVFLITLFNEAKKAPATPTPTRPTLAK